MVDTRERMGKRPDLQPVVHQPDKSTQANRWLDTALRLHGGAAEEGRECITRGYAVAPNQPRVLASINKIVRGLPRQYADSHEIDHAGTPGAPIVKFTKIFQGYPTALAPVNAGTGSRQSASGVEFGKVNSAPKWATALGEHQLNMLEALGDVGSLLEGEPQVQENSLLWARRDIDWQVGHLDAQVEYVPSPDILPKGIITLTPLDRNTNARVFPMREITRLGRLPTRAEFDELAVIVQVPLGQTLYMRYDTPHGGGNMPGLRLHGLLGSASLSLGTQSTYFLKVRPTTTQSARVAGKVRPRERSSTAVRARRTRVTPPQQPPQSKANPESHPMANDDMVSGLSLQAAIGGDDLVERGDIARSDTMEDVLDDTLDNCISTDELRGAILSQRVATPVSMAPPASPVSLWRDQGRVRGTVGISSGRYAARLVLPMVDRNHSLADEPQDGTSADGTSASSGGGVTTIAPTINPEDAHPAGGANVRTMVHQVSAGPDQAIEQSSDCSGTLGALKRAQSWMHKQAK